MSDGQERWHGRTAAEWEEAYRAERQARYHSAAERDEMQQSDVVPRSVADSLIEDVEFAENETAGIAFELHEGLMTGADAANQIAALCERLRIASRAFRAAYSREETP